MGCRSWRGAQAPQRDWWGISDVDPEREAGRSRSGIQQLHPSCTPQWLWGIKSGNMVEDKSGLYSCIFLQGNRSVCIGTFPSMVTWTSDTDRDTVMLCITTSERACSG